MPKTTRALPVLVALAAACGGPSSPSGPPEQGPIGGEPTGEWLHIVWTRVPISHRVVF